MFLVSTVISNYVFNYLTRGFYFVNSVWMGALFLLFMTTLVYEIVRIFYSANSRMAAFIILGVVGLLTLFSLAMAQFTQVKTVNIPFDTKLTAVQLSDIHVGNLYNDKFLKRLVDETNELEPDIVFITGDSVSGSAALRPGMFDELKNLKAPAYFVYGNHEYYEDKAKFKEEFKSTGIPVLEDEIVDFKGLQIVGLDYEEGRNYSKVFNNLKIDWNKPTIVLNHVPKGIEQMKKGVMLSGHTHAGQIIPFNFFVKLQFKYVKGLYKVGDSYLYVSPGTGTWGPPMRLGSRSEITLLRLG